MARYRKKPVVIDAVQWTGEFYDCGFMPEWLVSAEVDGEIATDCGTFKSIVTKEGVMRANPGDWIIKGVKGEIYPIEDVIFRETYEPADESDAA